VCGGRVSRVPVVLGNEFGSGTGSHPPRAGCASNDTSTGFPRAWAGTHRSGGVTSTLGWLQQPGVASDVRRPGGACQPYPGAASVQSRVEEPEVGVVDSSTKLTNTDPKGVATSVHTTQGGDFDEHLWGVSARIGRVSATD
jgi:hypothetical protein